MDWELAQSIALEEGALESEALILKIELMRSKKKEKGEKKGEESHHLDQVMPRSSGRADRIGFGGGRSCGLEAFGFSMPREDEGILFGTAEGETGGGKKKKKKGLR